MQVKLDFGWFEKTYFSNLQWNLPTYGLLPASSIFALFYLFRLYRHQRSNVLYFGFQSYYIRPLNVQYAASASRDYPKVAHWEQWLEASYLLLATSRAVPDSVSPALVKRGDCNRQRTWYQWVRGSVGAVDSHTVILQREYKRSAAVRQDNPVWLMEGLSAHSTAQLSCAGDWWTYTDPINATSNQKARPCTKPEFIMRNLKGISILKDNRKWHGNRIIQCTVVDNFMWFDYLYQPQTCKDPLLWPPGSSLYVWPTWPWEYGYQTCPVERDVSTWNENSRRWVRSNSRGSE